MEISVARVNLANTVLSHEDRRVCIEYRVSRGVRYLAKHFCRDVSVQLCFHENNQPRRTQYRFNKSPRIFGVPRSSENTRMCNNA